MSLFNEQAAFAIDVARFILKCQELGFLVSLREVQRTPEQQALYVGQGRSKTMKSNHLRCCAADMYFMRDGALVMDKDSLQGLGRYWESLHPKNSWGGNWSTFKDLPHFERRP